MEAETQRGTVRRLGRLAGVAVTTAIGAALTWLFCQGYVWKAQDPHRGAARLPWEPDSLVAVTVLEFLLLGVFAMRSVATARGIGALLWVIVLLLVVNVALTVALFGFPAY